MSTNSVDTLITDATRGFDLLLQNDPSGARELFAKTSSSPVHLIGLGIVDFLNALMSMEAPMLQKAAESLSVAESVAKREAKKARSSSSSTSSSGGGRFPKGVEWDVLEADAGMLHGLTQALSESYMGYLNCLYAMNTAHSRYSRISKQVFPGGMEAYSVNSFTKNAASTTEKAAQLAPPPIQAPLARPSLLTRISSSLLANLDAATKVDQVDESPLNGPSEELVVAGTAFGVGLFGLVGSTLPAKIRSVVSYFGFESSRKSAVHALMLSARRESDFHGVFSSLALMTYFGNMLSLSGYIHDEDVLIEKYRSLADSIESKYPGGTLWAWHRSRILRASNQIEQAINVLQDTVNQVKPTSFPQANALIAYELAWALVAARQYARAAAAFQALVNMNNWSHGSYLAMAAGCYMLSGDTDSAERIIIDLPQILERSKETRMGRKEIPSELFVRKKLSYWATKREQKGAKRTVDIIGISPALELGLFWNIHARTSPKDSHDNISTWSAMSPPVAPQLPRSSADSNSVSTGSSVDLDLDERCLRALLMGIMYRTLASYAESRRFLREATQIPLTTIFPWIGGIAMVETAILDVKEAEADPKMTVPLWKEKLDKAEERLTNAVTLVQKGELGSRVESRINIIRGQFLEKKESLGLP